MSQDAVEAVRQHYEAASGEQTLLSKVAALLESYPGDRITTGELTGLDQLHVRGHAATRDLAEMAEIREGMNVLDAGSGLGGLARFLAEAYGCDVTGIDLAPSFVAVAEFLTERTGLRDRVRFEAGDLARLPFPDQTFDLVWTQHVVMNLPDRGRVYSEFRRVLKPGGKLAFYDALGVEGQTEVLYPTPWAKTNATSFLLNEGQTRAALERAGFTIAAWRDVTREAADWAAQLPQTPPAGMNLAAVFGPTLAVATRNFGQNIREGRVRLAMAVCLSAL